MSLVYLNTWSVLIFVILFVLGVLFIYLLYKKNKQKISLTILFLSYLFLILTIFGFRGDVKINSSYEDLGNILFALDVSKSMNVVDIDYENSKYTRLDSSKHFINNFLDQNLNNNYGLLIFAGESLEVLPFTDSVDLYKTILSGVDNTNLTKSGTDLNSVFSSILTFFNDNEDIGTVVLITDGGDELNIDELEEKVKQIKQKKLKVVVVGVGSLEGNYILDGYDVFGRAVYKTYNGERVISKLNEESLKKMSRKYDFEYIKYDEINDFKNIEKLIQKNLELSLQGRGTSNREDLTRNLIFISFILFLVFLGVEYFEQKKK